MKVSYFRLISKDSYLMGKVSNQHRSNRSQVDMFNRLSGLLKKRSSLLLKFQLSYLVTYLSTFSKVEACLKLRFHI